MKMFSNKTLAAALLASAVALGCVGAVAAVQQHPPHAAPAGDPVAAALHTQFMGLAIELAHGADVDEVKPRIEALVDRYTAHSGEDREAMQTHVDEVVGRIVAAREEGPEALHRLMTQLFGEPPHH